MCDDVTSKQNTKYIIFIIIIFIVIIIIVKRLRPLPGVTTLFRDFYRRPILGASNHFYSVEYFIAGVRKHRETFKGFYLAKISSVNVYK